MSTLLQLRTRVRAYLDEPAPGVGSNLINYWTDAEINNWINQAYNYYYIQVAQSYSGYFTKETLINIVAAQNLYPVPVDFWDVRLLERVFATYTIPLRLFERMESPNITANSNFSNIYTPTYRFEGQNILLEPTPDTSITNGLRLEYLPTPILMILDTDSPNAGFIQFWEEPVVLRAAIACKQKEEAVVNSGTDVGTLTAMLQNWEQLVKESVEQRSMQRHYTEPFGIDESSFYYYP